MSYAWYAQVVLPCKCRASHSPQSVQRTTRKWLPRCNAAIGHPRWNSFLARSQCWHRTWRKPRVLFAMPVSPLQLALERFFVKGTCVWCHTRSASLLPYWWSPWLQVGPCTFCDSFRSRIYGLCKLVTTNCRLMHKRMALVMAHNCSGNDASLIVWSLLDFQTFGRRLAQILHLQGLSASSGAHRWWCLSGRENYWAR